MMTYLLPLALCLFSAYMTGRVLPSSLLRKDIVPSMALLLSFPAAIYLGCLALGAEMYLIGVLPADVLARWARHEIVLNCASALGVGSALQTYYDVRIGMGNMRSSGGTQAAWQRAISEVERKSYWEGDAWWLSGHQAAYWLTLVICPPIGLVLLLCQITRLQATISRRDLLLELQVRADEDRSATPNLLRNHA